jgi:hypothetical protein
LFIRQADDRWVLTPSDGPDAFVEIAFLDYRIALGRDLFSRLSFQSCHEPGMSFELPTNYAVPSPATRGMDRLCATY